MLTTQPIKNSGQASHYFFERDDYYTKEGQLYEKPSIWYGKGAARLGLDGKVDRRQFSELLSGRLPSGEQIGLQKNGIIKHRPGFDLTFNAPKSWSIANHKTKEPIFDEIFEKAVKSTLDYIERDCAMANEFKNGKQNMVKTANLVMSLHFHRLSREHDPHDHIHTVVKNMTARPDGSWRALKSDNPYKKQHQYSEGFIERVNARKKDYGQIYRNIHAALAEEAGMPVRWDDNGYWELASVPREIIDEFSTRSKQIREKMHKDGSIGGKAAALANLKTRAKKTTKPKQEIDENIQNRLNKYSYKITYESLFDKNYHNPTAEQLSYSAKEAVDYAINHLNEIVPSFSSAKLIATALQHRSAKTNIDSLMNVIDKYVDESILHTIKDQNGDIIYLSRDSVNNEKSILESIKIAKSSTKAIITSDKKFDKLICKYKNITDSQKSALKTILRSNERIMSIDGVSRSGKTHLATHIADLSYDSWYMPIVLSPSKSQLDDMPKKAKHQYMTISGFLKQVDIAKNYNNSNVHDLSLSRSVLIIDDSHRISTKQHAEIAKIIKRTNVRVIHLFDSKQPENYQPGNPIKLHSDASITKSILNKPYKSLEHLGIDIKSNGDTYKRHNSIINEYVKTKKSTPELDVQIIVQDKQTRNKINEEIQNVSTSKNSGIEKKILVSRYLTKSQLSVASNYKANDIIKFNRTYNSLGVQSNQYYEIKAINKDRNIIFLEVDGETVTWNPGQVGGRREGAIQVYKEETRRFYVNDPVVFTDNNKDFRLYKNQNFKISDVRDNEIALKNKDGKTLSFKKDSPILKHIDLAYAKTASQAYKDRPDILIAEQISNKKQTNQKEFYKIISQTNKSVSIHIDDKDKYHKSLSKQKGESNMVTKLLLKNIDSDKNINNKSDLSISNIERASSIKFKRDVEISALKEELKSKTISKNDACNKILDYVIDKHTENEAVVSHYELESAFLTKASNTGLALTSEETESYFNKAVIQNKIIPCIYKNESAFTTQTNINEERSVIKLAKETVGNGYSFATQNEVRHHILEWESNNNKLTNGQKYAVEKLASTKNALTLINGLAGVGKTTMLTALKPLCEKHNIRLIGLAPTNSATKELSERGIEGHTLDSFLNKLTIERNEHHNIDEARLIVLDESSMASTSKINNLLSITNNTKTRTAFVGDVAQLPSIERGKMFWCLQNIGIETTHVKDIIRQKNNPEYLSLVKDAYKGNFSNVLNKMKTKGMAHDDKIIINTTQKGANIDHIDNDQRMAYFIDQLMTKSSEYRSSTRVVTPSNVDRKLFNELYRNELQAVGEISQNQYKTTVLEEVKLLNSDKSHAMNYQIGQIIRFNSSISESGIKKDEYYSIKEVSSKNNHLTLVNVSSRELTALNLSNIKNEEWRFSIFNTEDRKLSVGDLIRWRFTDKSKNRINMSETKVIDVNKDKAIVQDSEGNKQVIDFKETRDMHFDYAYAGTAYTEQGKTAKNVAIYMKSTQTKLSSQPTFIVGLTRAMDGGLLVTDDITKLGKQLEINTGIKTSALEALDRLEKIQKSQNNVTLDEQKISPKDYKQHIDADEISSALTNDVENVAVHLLGAPKKKNGLNLFYGSNKGSLAIVINGKYKGTWKDFDTGEKGNLLTLIQKELNLDFYSALEYGAKIINYIPNSTLRSVVKKDILKKAIKEVELTKHQKNSIGYAKQLVSESRDIKGTLAEKYLKDIRGIDVNNASKDIRFHDGIYSKLNKSKNPALLIVARDKSENIQAVQAIYLDKQTGNKADVEIKKQSFGVLKDALFCANKTLSTSSIICEGPEDALSISKAELNKNVYACLGKSNFINIPADKLKDQKDIILALDNDGKRPSEMPNIMSSANKLKSNSNNIWLTQPGIIKQDYNDILKENINGENKIKELISNAVSSENSNIKLADSQQDKKPNKDKLYSHKEIEII